MKILFDTQSRTLLPWPRLDNEPVVGLAPYLLEMNIIEEPKPEFNPSTERLIMSETINEQARTVTRRYAVQIVPVLAFTAEQWISQFLSSLQIIALQRLEMAVITSGQTLGPAMSTMKTWLEGILLASSANPSPRSDWPTPSTTYQAASQEASGQLQSN
jgi:hypothetical protein